MIRKNITISASDYAVIADYVRHNGYSFSQFLRTAAMEKIKKDEDSSLLEFLNKNVDYVSDEEQKDIDDLKLDYSNIEGEEISLDEFL